MTIDLDDFECKCGHKYCDAVPVDPTFFTWAQDLEAKWGKPLTITSGCRCADHNAAVGGKPDSQHLFGKAMDVFLGNPNDTIALIALAESMGVGGVGAANLWCHLDKGPAGRRWKYPPATPKY